MKFAHLADCHIGSWRDPKLKDISTLAFIKAVDICIRENVDFVLIAGDLFNTSVPRIDNLKTVVTAFKKLKDRDIAVYVIPGSHDFSPSGKTMLDVLEEAGMFINVVKGKEIDGKLHLHFTVDKKTGAKIVGMLGRRNSLEKKYYEELSTDHLEKEDGYKIFMFHSGIDEMKTADLMHTISQPLSLLPKGFAYYAGGHVHTVAAKKVDDFGIIAYPGPLFPNSFSELEKLQRGGFYLVENNNPIWHPIQMYNIVSIIKNCNGKNPEDITNELLQETKGREFIDTIVLIRLHGTLASGKLAEIDFREIFSAFYGKSAYFVMKNTNALQTKEFEEIQIDAHSVEDIEEKLIREHLGQIKIESLSLEKEQDLIRQLMTALSTEKMEGETVNDFEKRVRQEAGKIMGMELK